MRRTGPEGPALCLAKWLSGDEGGTRRRSACGKTQPRSLAVKSIVWVMVEAAALCAESRKPISKAPASETKRMFVPNESRSSERTDWSGF